MKGVAASLPTWAYILHLSETYGIPPWRVADECTEEWFGYMKAWDAAKTKARKDG